MKQKDIEQSVKMASLAAVSEIIGTSMLRGYEAMSLCGDIIVPFNTATRIRMFIRTVLWCF